MRYRPMVLIDLKWNIDPKKVVLMYYVYSVRNGEFKITKIKLFEVLIHNTPIMPTWQHKYYQMFNISHTQVKQIVKLLKYVVIK